MKKNIKIILLLFLFLAIPKNVKAETDYYDDEGNLFRLVFDDTPLRNFVKTDFAIVYDDLDFQGKTIARYDSTSQSGTYQYSAGYDIEKELIILIYETRESWQQKNNEKYIVNVVPHYTSASNGGGYPCIYFDHKIYKHESNGNRIRALSSRYMQKGEYGTNLLNFVVNNSTDKMLIEDGGIWHTAGQSRGILLSVDKNGNWQKLTDLYNTNYNLYNEINTNTEQNLIYSSKNIYSFKTNELLISKEEFEERTITSNYSITCDDENPYIYDLHFDISDLKTNDKVVITYNDDSILLNETLTEQRNSFTIENAKTGNYNIKVYDESDELIHENNFEIEIQKEYEIEDSTEEKETINENELIINEDITNLIKNNFLQISKNENLYKIIITIFITSLIIIIKNKI